VTGLRAGIHPDHIKSTSIDLIMNDDGTTQTFMAWAMTGQPLHIVNVDIALVCLKREAVETSEAALKKQIQEVDTNALANQRGVTPVNVSLFTGKAWLSGDEDRGGFYPHDNTAINREYICTAGLTAQAPSWKSGPELFGRFCDGGLFAEINCPSSQYGARVVVNYIDRLAFSPAYADAPSVLQHYWDCAHTEDGEEFLSGFYGGTDSDPVGGSSESTHGSSGGGNIFDQGSSLPSTTASVL